MRARAPGSVTLLFAPADDPEDGSYGVSFAVADGVVADVTPLDGTDAPAPDGSSGGGDGEGDGVPASRVTLDGEPTSFEPVERALRELGVAASVDLTAEVPVGSGFGASGAATLAAALAAGEAFDLDASREDLLGVAHRAEVAAGTGLGDVFVQEAGGMLYDVGDGGGRGRRTVDGRLEYVSYAGIATDGVLGDAAAVERVREAGRDHLARFDPGGPLAATVELGWSFARATGLATERVTDAVDRVRTAGGAASMAMLGETVLATDVDGVFPEETHVTDEGARVL
jgi:pantoate kinase